MTTRIRKSPAAAGEHANRLYTRNGRYYADLRDLGGGREAMIPPHQTYATKDEAVAIDLLAARLRDLIVPERERHFRGVTRQVTVGVFVREWLDDKRALAGRGGEGFTSPRTLRRYEQAIQPMFTREVDGTVPLDEDTLIASVSLTDVRRVIRLLRSAVGGGYSAASLHQLIQAMQLVFDAAADEGVVPSGHNPWRQLRRADRPRLPRQSRTDFLETYEVRALLDAADELAPRIHRVPLEVLLRTYAYTGGREKEVLGLCVEDVDFRRDTVRFVSNRFRPIKTADERTVPLWPELKRVLQPYVASLHRISGLLFPGYAPRTGAEQMLTKLHKPLVAIRTQAATRLGEPYGPVLAGKALNSRVLRVSYCSARLQTLDGGRPVAIWTVIQEMGHSSKRMVETVYGRVGNARHRGDVVEYVSLGELNDRNAQDNSLGPSLERRGPDPMSVDVRLG